jgi:hypothetical protein
VKPRALICRGLNHPFFLFAVSEVSEVMVHPCISAACSSRRIGRVVAQEKALRTPLLEPFAWQAHSRWRCTAGHVGGMMISRRAVAC